jgi:hypothetical protein
MEKYVISDLHPSSDQLPPLFLMLAESRSRFTGESEYVEDKEGVSRERIHEASDRYRSVPGLFPPK